MIGWTTMPFSGAMRRAAQRREQNRPTKTNQVHPAAEHPSFWNSVSDEDKTAVQKFQRVVRRVIYNQRLHREHLAERLTFEHKIVFGTLRLFSQIILFTLLIEGMRISSNQTSKRGIFKNLQEAFDFDALENTVIRAEFLDVHLPAIAAKSKDFFILSSKYFDAEDAGYVQLLGKMHSFSKPIPSVALELGGLQEFSFTAWVRAGREFNAGYIVRKPTSSAGGGSELSCWGWHLHAAYGPSFHYGGHDFFPVGTAADDQRQIEIVLSSAEELRKNEYVLHTLVIETTRVTFYQNLKTLGSRPLPRAAVDCFNAGAGTLVGGTALELGDVRFHPRAIHLPVIEELFTAGSKLEDIATGSDPHVDDASELETAERSITSSITEVEEAVANRQHLSELGAVLKAAQESERFAPPLARSPEAPVGQIEVNQTLLSDPSVGREFTSLVKGPWTLSQTSDADARYLSNFPRSDLHFVQGLRLIGKGGGVVCGLS